MSLPLRSFTLALVAFTALGSIPAPEARARTGVPGFRVSQRSEVGPGLRHLVLRNGGGRPQVVNVARLGSNSPYRIQTVPARRHASGSGPALETTSALCRRVDCLIAVNGDFFDGGRPLGGLVRNGIVLKPGRGHRVQAIFDTDKQLVTGNLRLSGSVVLSDLRELSVEAVDRKRLRGKITLYTPGARRRTPRNHQAVDVVLRIVDPSGPLRIGQTSIARAVSIRRGGAARIQQGHIVLTGTGRAREQLLAFWKNARAGTISTDALVRLESKPSAWQSVGGRPVIVRDGKPRRFNSRSSFTRGRHPRTLLGRTRDGSVLLVTVDGRQRGRQGMTLPEAARLMVRLGAVEAINLDGGGSTTFVRRGRVVNRPSGGGQRRVAVALAVVRKDRDPGGPGQPRLSRMALPANAQTLPAASVADPIHPPDSGIVEPDPLLAAAWLRGEPQPGGRSRIPDVVALAAIGFVIAGGRRRLFARRSGAVP